MAKAMAKDLSEQERACLEHVRQARELGLTFARYCRERDLRVHQWYWIKRALTRKGVITALLKAEAKRPAGFVSVRIAPAAAVETVCRIRHPSGWVIECGSVPQPQWLSALMSGSST